MTKTIKNMSYNDLNKACALYGMEVSIKKGRVVGFRPERF